MASPVVSLTASVQIIIKQGVQECDATEAESVLQKPAQKNK
jgi:hypothetical protein